MKKIAQNESWDNLGEKVVALFRDTVQTCLMSLDELQRARLIDRLVKASLHMKGNSESRDEKFRDEMEAAAAIIAGDTDA